MNDCKICHAAPAINRGATCGLSECQETDYHLSMARSARTKRARAEHATKAHDAEDRMRARRTVR